MKKKIYAFIFVRKNSKRLKNKNISKLGDKPLLSYSIDIAKRIKKIDKIFVSTDSEKMIKIAKKKNVEFIKRPKKLCEDRSNEIFSWTHAIDFLKSKGENFDIFLSLPVTSPLRKKIDIIKMLNLFEKKNADLVVSVTKTNRIPNYNMVKVSNSGRTKIAVEKQNFRLNKNEKLFDMTTVGYVSYPKYIKKVKDLFFGKIYAVEIPRNRSLDIDDKFDLKMGKLLIK